MNFLLLYSAIIGLHESLDDLVDCKTTFFPQSVEAINLFYTIPVQYFPSTNHVTTSYIFLTIHLAQDVVKSSKIKVTMEQMVYK
jgi:hypothetical protein